MQYAYLFRLFEPVSLLPKQFNAFNAYIFAATCVFLTSYSDAGAGYTFYPLSTIIWISNLTIILSGLTITFYFYPY